MDAMIKRLVAAAAIALALNTPAALAQTHAPTGAYSYTDRQTIVPTVQNASYASGNDIGGLQSVTFNSNGNITIINEVAAISISGQTPSLFLYLFDSQPAGTFTDKGTFSLAAGDRAKLIVPPISLTLAQVNSGTGDAGSYAENANMVRFPVAKSGTIWFAVMVGTTFTPGSTSDIVLSLQATQRDQGTLANGSGFY